MSNPTVLRDDELNSKMDSKNFNVADLKIPKSLEIRDVASSLSNPPQETLAISTENKKKVFSKNGLLERDVFGVGLNPHLWASILCLSLLSRLPETRPVLLLVGMPLQAFFAKPITNGEATNSCCQS
ncbi:hypothetical protein V6N13_054980 [Hibiscus sabdariffa]